MTDNTMSPAVPEDEELPFPPSDATVLYRFYDAHGRLLYVGITSSMAQRFRHHEKFAAWMRLAASVKLEHFDRREDAARAEVLAIKSEKPAWNIAHADDRPVPPRWKAPAEREVTSPGAPVPFNDACNELGLSPEVLRSFENRHLIRTRSNGRIQRVPRDSIEVLRRAYQFEGKYRERALENVRRYNAEVGQMGVDIFIEIGVLCPRSGPERDAWLARAESGAPLPEFRLRDLPDRALWE